MAIRRIEVFTLVEMRMEDYTSNREGEGLVWAEEMSISIQVLEEEALVLVDHRL